MKKRIFVTLISVFVLFFFIQQKEQWASVFRVTEQPDVLMKGNHGMTLTVDLSFGREDVDEWITKLEKPYPLLFLDADWIERSPLIVKKIKEKKIPVGLLGQESKQYEENPELLGEEIERFKTAFGDIPLWYRTYDHVFPEPLKTQVWDSQMNMLSANVNWTTGSAPSVRKGDIVSVALHQETRVGFEELIAYQKAHSFVSIEETLFGYQTQTKTFP
ncbi:hypothetical protein M9R32_10955 [Paenisporosarcina quisquiliarum]|uniref:Polysaccharide deacetylase n=1 Tax=Paenisporosarcina quisquiliarum TaxID=365346 RepID=A0A9X3LGV3_9BACL|nr:hypothetical protein [Paenisporosarcina quisquiliarum]MCZ8537703.1 hypothetical protein [Paenisporosarcina quisquiliarum]